MSDAPTEELQPILSRFRPSRTLLLDLGTSYLASIARVASAAVIVGLLFRMTHPHYVAAFVLVRSLYAVLTYCFGGWQPTALRLLSEAQAVRATLVVADAAPDARPASTVIDYRARAPAAVRTPSVPFNLFVVSALAVLVVYPILELYAAAFVGLHGSPITRDWFLRRFVAVFGIGLLWRAASEPAGAILQSRGRLWLDNLLITFGEIAWVALSIHAMVWTDDYGERFQAVAVGYWISGAALYFCRWIAQVEMRLTTDEPFFTALSFAMIRRFFRAATAISLGHFADFLYAPMNVLLINYALSRDLIDDYGPALQIDAALLLTVAAIAVVILPRVSRAAALGDVDHIRRLYRRAMLASVSVLVISAAVVVIFRRPLLHTWLGEAPPVLVTILPLVLVHTVLGGTAGIGRAVLLGMGKFRVYTISALLGGLVNLTLALFFVLVLGWGLRSIVTATIIAVTLRCAVWMPWYVLRTLREPVTPPPVEKAP